MSVAGRSSDWERSIDIRLGLRVRDVRLRAGLSQTQLGDAVGLTFQQIQKYEAGANRISVSRLLGLAEALGAPAGDFLNGLEDDVENLLDAPHSDSIMLSSKVNGRLSAAQLQDATPEGLAYTRATLELVRAFWGIDAEVVRKRLLSLTLSLAQASRGDLPFPLPSSQAPAAYSLHEDEDEFERAPRRGRKKGG
jgi:transcriptional regulator with XRE-family HTH domain